MTLTLQTKVTQLTRIWMKWRVASGERDSKGLLMVPSRALFFARYSKTYRILRRHGKSISGTSSFLTLCPPRPWTGASLQGGYLPQKAGWGTMNPASNEILDAKQRVLSLILLDQLTKSS